MSGGTPLPLRRRLKKLGIRFLAFLTPFVYLGYMKLVAATSRIRRNGVDEIFEKSERGVDVTLAVLHQDVFACPFLFRGHDILTLANVGDAGDIVAAILERCGFDVARGGSSTRMSRRTPALREFIRRAQERPTGKGKVTAITPDGSKGPAGAIRPGIALFAIKTGAEPYCVKIHARRAIYVPTWDRTMIPLPFGDIWIDVEGPLDLPVKATRTDLESIRSEIEERLHTMHRRAFARDGREPLPLLQHLAPPPPRTSRQLRA